MIFQGMPWPLVIPIAIMAMIYGSMQTKKAFALAEKKALKQAKKRKKKSK